MQIQYVGFRVVASSRIYSFHVIEGSEKTRDFALEVASDAFRLSALKFQDGPGLCQARLTRELHGETAIAPTPACLSIGNGDIEQYLAGQCLARGRPRRKFRHTPHLQS